LSEAINKARALHRAGKLAEAESLYREVLGTSADQFDALHLLGILKTQQGQHGEALALVTQALSRDPGSARARATLGSVLHALNRHEDALASYDQALAAEPDLADALYNRGVTLQALGRHDEALASFDQALAIKPDFIEALINRGNALQALTRHAEALESYDRALAIRPDHPEALSNRGTTLHALGRHAEALASFNQALAIRPDFADAFYSRGITLHALGRHAEAIASYDQALATRPDFTDALYNRGITLHALKRHAEALASYDQALALKPDFIEALNNRGTVLHALDRHAEALASYDQALAINPVFAEAHFNRGNSLQELDRHLEALASFDKALVLKPEYDEAIFNRCISLHALNRHVEMLRNIGKALASEHKYKYALGMFVHSRAHICDWREYGGLVQRLESGVRAGTSCSHPFPFITVSDSPAAQLACASSYAGKRYPGSSAPLWRGERYGHERIRIAYLSADFREHPVAQLLVELLEKHSREKIETFGISFGPDTHDDMRSRLANALEHFIDVRGMGDEDAAALLRESEIDIAVDLTGFTASARTGILARRPAPIQVNYLGYMGTLGADYIDYIIADEFVIPRDRQIHYSEKVVYLPDSFQVNGTTRKIAVRTPTRAEAGLPGQGFVFCCFNNSYKINPPVFEIWMRLMHRVEGSVLWLAKAQAETAANLRREAQARGIDPARLVFAPRRGRIEDHLARYRLADLFLDTLPYNAHATAGDALLAGLPLLTRAGEAFAGRVSGSLLNAAGLPELVTSTPEEYEALAVKLAADGGARLREMRERLARNRLTAPLFDTERYCRHIEAAYTTMWKRYQRGEKPESFSVEPSSQRQD
jgi:protein O-GlcNAc transferase